MKKLKKKWYESYQPLNDYVLVKQLKKKKKPKVGYTNLNLTKNR